MAESNSSVVSIVGIVAIVILVGLGIYFFMIANGDSADIEIDLPGASVTQPAPDFTAAERTSPAGLTLAA